MAERNPLDSSRPVGGGRDSQLVHCAVLQLTSIAHTFGEWLDGKETKTYEGSPQKKEA